MLDRETLDSILEGLLHQDEPPQIMALDENGVSCPMPSSVPILSDEHIDIDGSVLALVVRADLSRVVEAWERSRRIGMAQIVIHLRSDPCRPVTLHFLDARYRYGVYLALMFGIEAELRISDVESSLFAPRLCKLERDQLAIIVDVDDATTKILGWSRAELLGKRTLDLLHPEDRPGAIAGWVEMLAHAGFYQRGLFRYRHRDGRYIWLESTNDNRLADAATARVVTQMVDVSDRMEAIEALRANEHFLRRLTEALPIGIVQMDAERRIVHTNERLSAIVGIAKAATIGAQLNVASASDRNVLEAVLGPLLEFGTAADIELTIGHPRGHRRCSVGFRALSNDEGTVTGAIACVLDITDSVLMREELQTRATFDNLTLCYNRPAILEKLAALLSLADRNHTGTAVLFIDLDRFKEVNDRFGHAAGDEVLRRVAERLLRDVRAGDVVGRLGGDEFLVVCPNVATPEFALETARRHAVTIAQATDVGAHSIIPTASIGVAWTLSPVKPDTLVAQADAAMYESKLRSARPVLFQATVPHGHRLE